jgi:hypothetical protein
LSQVADTPTLTYLPKYVSDNEKYETVDCLKSNTTDKDAPYQLKIEPWYKKPSEGVGTIGFHLAQNPFDVTKIPAEEYSEACSYVVAYLTVTADIAPVGKELNPNGYLLMYSVSQSSEPDPSTICCGSEKLPDNVEYGKMIVIDDKLVRNCGEWTPVTYKVFLKVEDCISGLQTVIDGFVNSLMANDCQNLRQVVADTPMGGGKTPLQYTVDSSGDLTDIVMCCGTPLEDGTVYESDLETVKIKIVSPFVDALFVV